MAQAVTAGSNPIVLKKGIDKTCEFLVAKLKEVARPVKGTEDIKVRLAIVGPLTPSYTLLSSYHCCNRQSAALWRPVQAAPTVLGPHFSMKVVYESHLRNKNE